MTQVAGSPAYHIATGLATITPYRERLREMLRNRAWLAANIEALRAEHAERWVVIAGQSIRGVGQTAEVALAQAGAVDESTALVLMVPARIPRPI